MVKLNKIYTRTGDDGSTGLADGSRVPKHSPRPKAYGSVDELNSMSKVSSPLQSTCEGIGAISIVGFTVTITSKLFSIIKYLKKVFLVVLKTLSRFLKTIQLLCHQ